MQLMHHDLSKHAALMASVVAPSWHQQPQLYCSFQTHACQLFDQQVLMCQQQFIA